MTDTFILSVDPTKTGEEQMAADIPPAMANMIASETAGNIQQANSTGRDATVTANNVLKYAAARNFDELGTIESRANSGVIATPVASPAVQTGGGA